MAIVSDQRYGERPRGLGGQMVACLAEDGRQTAESTTDLDGGLQCANWRDEVLSVQPSRRAWWCHAPLVVACGLQSLDNRSLFPRRGCERIGAICWSTRFSVLLSGRKPALTG
jgi:hypothetical protein